MKTIIKYLALFIAALSLGATINTTNAQAKRAATLRSISTYDAKPVKASRGYMYRTYKLTKRVHHLTNYRNTKFFKIATVKIRTAKGKNAYYNYLTTANGKTQGYVWHGFVHKRTVTKHQPTYESSTDVDTNTDTDTNIDHDNTSTETPTFTPADFSNNLYAQIFLNELNAERAKRGIAPLTIDNTLAKAAQKRAIETTGNIYNKQHRDSSGQLAVKKYLNGDPSFRSLGECLNTISISTNSNKMISNATDTITSAKYSLHVYIYDDAASNWGHREILLNPNYSRIGIGANLDSQPNSDPELDELGVSEYNVFDAIVLAN